MEPRIKEVGLSLDVTLAFTYTLLAFLLRFLQPALLLPLIDVRRETVVSQKIGIPVEWP